MSAGGPAGMEIASLQRRAPGVADQLVRVPRSGLDCRCAGLQAVPAVRRARPRHFRSGHAIAPVAARARGGVDSDRGSAAELDDEARRCGLRATRLARPDRGRRRGQGLSSPVRRSRACRPWAQRRRRTAWCAGGEAGIRWTTSTVARTIAHSHISPRKIALTDDQLTNSSGCIASFRTGPPTARDQLASSVSPAPTHSPGSYAPVRSERSPADRRFSAAQPAITPTRPGRREAWLLQ
jgi:hypothetical protein